MNPNFDHLMGSVAGILAKHGCLRWRYSFVTCVLYVLITTCEVDRFQ